MRKEFSLLACAAMYIVMVWLVVGSVEVSATAGVGDPAPSFSLVDALSGDTISLADCEGKVVLLDFFATWCPHCREAFDNDLVPLYNQSYVDDPHVMFLSISIWEEGTTAEQLQDFASDHNVTWPILMGSQSTIVQDYEITCLPTIFIVDGDGVIQHRYNCVTSSIATILKEEIDALRVPLAVDTNDDGVVDVFDLSTVAKAFGSTPDDPSWNPAADINNDNIIDISDVILVTNYYGNTA